MLRDGGALGASYLSSAEIGEIHQNLRFVPNALVGLTTLQSYS